MLKEELSSQLSPFKSEIRARFDEISSQIDGLYLRDEKRELEYLSLRSQVGRLEEKIA